MEEKHSVDFIINTIIGILKNQKEGTLKFWESNFGIIFMKQKIDETKDFFLGLSEKNFIF